LITNTGKGILAKYLIGQVPSYASYIAIGVGPKPLETDEDIPEILKEKTSLDFEVFRVPIISRGYVYNDDETVDVVFAAELPTNQRYEFTEVGLFPGTSNPSAGTLDSKMIYTFSQGENWKYHSETAEQSIEPYITPLNLTEVSQNNILIYDKAFFTNADNSVLNDGNRITRYERTRFLDRALMISGNLSNLEEEVVGSSVIGLKFKESEDSYFGEHIHLTGARPPLDKNSLKDELRLAFSVVNRLAIQTENSETINKVMIMIEFASTDSDDPTNFARYYVNMQGSLFNTNRYHVKPMTLQGLRKSVGFTWNTVNVTKIYASVFGNIDITQKSLTDNVATLTTPEKHGFDVGNSVTISGIDSTFNGEYIVTEINEGRTSFSYEKTASNVSSSAANGSAIGPSNKFLIALDGFRFENTTAKSPVYGLTGYSLVRNENALPIVKQPNSSNIVEFRFGMDTSL